MRTPWSMLAVMGIVLAGCTGPPKETGPGDGPEETGYSLDCSVFPGEGGPQWLQACVAFASPNESPSKAEVDIAVNPTDPLNIVVASKDKDPTASDDCVWSVAQVTKDGGKNWTTVYVGGDRDNRVPETRSYQCVTDPIMVFDEDGVFYYALQAYQHEPQSTPDVPQVGTPSAGSAFILARSRDGGLTFDHYVVQAPGAGDLLFHDYPRMLVHPTTGDISTIWNAYTSGPVVPAYRVAPVVSTTRDGGETVDPPVSWTADDAPYDTQFFSGFAANKEGRIFVTIAKNSESDAGNPTVVWIWSSNDGARTFEEVGPAFVIHPTPRQYEGHDFRTPSFVEMAIDNSLSFSGRIYLFWPEWTSGQSDILCRFSDDDGVTWSEPVNVANRVEGDQIFMRPRVGPDGHVHVLFTTTAYSNSTLLDQAHSVSMDGSRTWEETRLTNVSFDGDLGIHQDGFPFIGDYNGLVVGPDSVVHAAWGDTSTGRAEIAYARILPPSDPS